MRLLCWVLFLVLMSVMPVLAEEQMTKTVFPKGELFEPLVADAKEPQFSVGLHQVNSSGRLGEFTAGIVGYGEHFGAMGSG